MKPFGAVVALFVAAGLVLAGCSPDSSEAEATLGPSPARTPTPRAEESPAPQRVDLKVWNEATGRDKGRVARAIRDLKKAGIWKKVVWKGLYVIQIQARAGEQRIPEDRHLADASFHAFKDEDGGGALCFILIYTEAIRQDIANWNHYDRLGLARYPPPAPRDVWAAALAHELGHCHKGFRGEKHARNWESRAWKTIGRPDLADFPFEKSY